MMHGDDQFWDSSKLDRSCQHDDLLIRCEKEGPQLKLSCIMANMPGSERAQA